MNKLLLLTLVLLSGLANAQDKRVREIDSLTSMIDAGHFTQTLDSVITDMPAVQMKSRTLYTTYRDGNNIVKLSCAFRVTDKEGVTNISAVYYYKNNKLIKVVGQKIGDKQDQSVVNYYEDGSPFYNIPDNPKTRQQSWTNLGFSDSFISKYKSAGKG